MSDFLSIYKSGQYLEAITAVSELKTFEILGFSVFKSAHDIMDTGRIRNASAGDRIEVLSYFKSKEYISEL
jgi:hypothetical protein